MSTPIHRTLPVAGVSILATASWLALHGCADMPGPAAPLGDDAASSPRGPEQEVPRIALPSTSAHGVLAVCADDVALYARCENGADVYVETFERNPTLDLWEGCCIAGSVQDHATTPYSTSYVVKNVRGRQSNELFLLGCSPAGETVIERWTLSEHPGSQFVHVAPSGTAVGVAQPPLPAVSWGIIGGGPYVPMADRPRSRHVQRSELFRRTLAGTPDWMLVDPEDRYVVVATRFPCILYQCRTGTTDDPTVLATEITTRDLARTTGIALAQHVTEGRLIHLVAGAHGTVTEDIHVILADIDNDGVFDAPSVLSQSAWVARGYDGMVWYRTTLNDWTLP